jgi:hypothetical protein
MVLYKRIGKIKEDMDLVYLGDNLDASVEHELINNFKFGVNATVDVFNERIVYTNLTEIHHRYHTPVRDKRIAFESNLHGTGGTASVTSIKRVSVEPAVILHSALTLSVSECKQEEDSYKIKK